MSTIDRREFMRRTAAGVAAGLGNNVLAAENTSSPPSTRPASGRILRATDVITLGKTGINPSRLSFGTGSRGEQTKLGIDDFAKLLRYAKDKGIYWWDSADLYGTHPHVAAALKEIKRDEVVILSKTQSKDAAGVRKDIERFLKELNTDYIDIVLLHCMSDDEWPTKMGGPMDVLSEAKDKGLVRAVGSSLHVQGKLGPVKLLPLKAAANLSWGDVHMVRINPFAQSMDVNKTKYIPQLEEVFRAMHKRSKGLYGMKLLGGNNTDDRRALFQGDKIDKSLRFALTRDYIAGFTIGMVSEKEVDDIIQRIERLAVPAPKQEKRVIS